MHSAKKSTSSASIDSAAYFRNISEASPPGSFPNELSSTAAIFTFVPESNRVQNTSTYFSIVCDG